MVVSSQVGWDAVYKKRKECNNYGEKDSHERPSSQSLFPGCTLPLASVSHFCTLVRLSAELAFSYVGVFFMPKGHIRTTVTICNST